MRRRFASRLHIPYGPNLGQRQRLRLRKHTHTSAERVSEQVRAREPLRLTAGHMAAGITHDRHVSHMSGERERERER